MQYHTVRFGTIEVGENEIISFPDGLPGFQSITKFVMLNIESYRPFSFLQSLEEPNLTFILVNPYEYFEGYPSIQEIQKACSVTDIAFELEHWSIRAIVTINANLITANLIGPLVIHSQTRIGQQVILSAFPGLHTKHPILSQKPASKEAY